ncbi:hypothetical protein [Spirosoma spitsbergense]|uniref:hypothetical protein n=1 Tax=Spirosoma spitsbergense TaxID=431554 RepID=UPI00036F9335|nr:hypothetical protein [Spirosoma spitsbergense]
MRTSTHVNALTIVACFFFLFILILACSKQSDPTPTPGTTTTPVSSTTTTTPSTSTTAVAATAPVFDTTVLSTIDFVTETAGQVSSTVKSNGGSAITQQGHVYSETNQSPTTSDSKTQLGRNDGPFPGKFTSALTGLKASTTYYIRPYATNDKGTTYGTMIQMKTTASSVITSATKTIDCNNIPEVWEDLGIDVDYLVKCTIYVTGTKVVTIKPGVKIQFEGSAAGFAVSSQAALVMVGTQEKPIILEGKVASAGYWKGITLNAVNIENRWEYVTIRHAGATQNAALLIGEYANVAIRVSIKNSTFSTNSGYGILDTDGFYSSSHFTGFESNTFSDNSKAPLKITAPSMGSLDSKSSYANNGQKFIEVTNAVGGVDNDMIVQKLDVPYRVLSVVNFAQKVTFMPGVTVEFGTDAGFSNSFNSKNGSIIADGTAANPIKFIGYLAGTKALWKGIVIGSGNPETKFNYCVIDGAGSIVNSACEGSVKTALTLGATGCGSFPGRGTVANCTITNSGGYAVVFKTGDPVILTNNTYSGNTSGDVYNLK